MKYSFKKQIRSFGYAWKGIRQCVGKEQNLSFHLITTTVVIAAGFFFGITRTEWIVIILCIGVVIAAELFNTAIEKLVDLVSPERHPIAGQVKTLPPEQCWCALLRRAIIGIIIFLPYLS
ncbi:MAG: diacylglycerol kinase family protein [Bacteroides cellulosilyticus]